MIVGEMMKNVHDKLVLIAVKSSELLELVQWDLPVDPLVASKLIDEMRKLLDEVKKEIS
jgi:hypothetical protein